MPNLSYMQKATDRGQLQIHVTTERGFFPIKDASIRLSYTGNPTEIIEELSTDISGQTAAVELPAPPLEYSMEPSEFQPYSEYTIQVNASGYRPINISGISVLPDKTSIQNVRMETATVENPLERNIVITANTLYGNFPPKIPEDEIKPMTESGEIVLSRVVIPEYVIVHDGPPSDSSANGCIRSGTGTKAMILPLLLPPPLTTNLSTAETFFPTFPISLMRCLIATFPARTSASRF